METLKERIEWIPGSVSATRLKLTVACIDDAGCCIYWGGRLQAASDKANEQENGKKEKSFAAIHVATHDSVVASHSRKGKTVKLPYAEERAGKAR